MYDNFLIFYRRKDKHFDFYTQEKQQISFILFKTYHFDNHAAIFHFLRMDLNCHTMPDIPKKAYLDFSDTPSFFQKKI